MNLSFSRGGLLSLALAIAIAGCGGDDVSPTDAGGGADTGTGADAGRPGDAGDRADARTISDAATPADAGTVADSGPRTDGGGAASDAGPTTCSSSLGAMCGGMMACASGYECNLGRCLPQARQVCGGFAGAPCTDALYTQCLYFTSADFGTCLTPAERACLCALPDAASHYVCT